VRVKPLLGRARPGDDKHRGRHDRRTYRPEDTRQIYTADAGDYYEIDPALEGFEGGKG